MADKAPEFKPDIEAALRLTISALAQIASSLPHGVPRNLQLAQNLLDPPVPADEPPAPTKEEVVAETPTPARFPAKIAS